MIQSLTKWCLFSLVLISFGLTGPSVHAQPLELEDVPRITVPELKALLDKGEQPVFLDVRSGHDYEGSKIKIKGAIRIPLVQLQERYKELPRDREVVAYCT